MLFPYTPNKPAAPNPAMASLFNGGRQWRGVGDPRRSAASVTRYNGLRLCAFAPLESAKQAWQF